MLQKVIPDIQSEEKIQLFWWYLVIIVSTVIFKSLYIDTMFRSGFTVTMESYLSDSSPGEYIKILSLLFVRDLTEVSLLLFAAYIIIYKIAHIKLKVLIVASTMMVFLVETSNFISLQNISSLLSYDTLKIAIDWVRHNPNALDEYVKWPNGQIKRRAIFFYLAYLMVLICLSFFPLIAVKFNVRSKIVKKAHFLAIPFCILAITISSLIYYLVPALLKENAYIKPFNGYWISVLSSLTGVTNASPINRAVPSLDKLKSDYARLIYPGHEVNKNAHSINNISGNIEKKHILIISLETAPLKYYPIVNNPRLKNFHKMSEHSIITNKHFSNTPYTTYANYSMLTGMYTPESGVPIKYGNIKVDGLANALEKSNYITTYIDSFNVDWHGGDNNKKTIKNLGFKNIFQRSDYDFKIIRKKIKNMFDRVLHAESRSFKVAMEQILFAEQNNRKSLVFIDTILGHYDWKTRNGDENLENSEKILKIAEAFDALMGEVLDFIDNNNLEKDIIIVITGDHGLRYLPEYKSLGEKNGDIPVAFNVPFMMYSPGLFSKQVILDHVTSHVDLAPTLLDLNNIDRKNMFHHGSNMLYPINKNRVIFLMNQRLKPFSSFYWDGMFYSHNTITNESLIIPYTENIKLKEINKLSETPIPDNSLNPTEIIVNAKEHFEDTSAFFLQR